ncbi:MAG: NYN domain-containing protein [Pseudomonadota bacterium]
MHFYPDERVGLFVDGPNFYGAARSLGFDVDYGALLRFLRGKARLVRAAYYTAVTEDTEFSSIRPLVDWLDYNGYHMVTKPTKEFIDPEGNRRVKGNMDVELAVDIVSAARTLDHVVLLSGDGDFRYLVETVQRMGVRVTVVSTKESRPPMIADELRRQADQYIDLMDLRDDIGRTGGRPQRNTDTAPSRNDDNHNDEYVDDDDDDIDRFRNI